MAIDLNNDLTLRFIRLIHEFHQRIVEAHFELFPTAGTTAGQSPDEYRFFNIVGQDGVSHAQGIYDAAIGKSRDDIVTLIRNQYVLYQTDPEATEEPLRPLLEYIASVGVKP